VAEERSRGVGALCAVQFVDVLGVTVVVTALPAMLRDLNGPPAAAGLVVTSYAMFFGGLLVLGARCGDRFGHRRVLQAGLALFGAASVLAAVAPAVPVLVSARCLQGAAAAASVPAALRLVAAVAPGESARRRALALWSGSGAAAGASGFVLGGLFTQFASWRVIFGLTTLLAVLLAVVVRRQVPADRGELGLRLDVAGAVVLTGAVMALVIGAALLEQPVTRAPGALGLACGGVLLAALAPVERRQRDPLLPAAAVRNPSLRAGAAGSFLNTAATSSAMTLVTLYLQDVMRIPPGPTGLLLLPFSLAVVLGAAAAAPALARRPARYVTALGLVLIAAGDLALVPARGVVPAVPGCVAVAGFGIGLSSVASTSLGTAVPDGVQGVASGVLNTAAQLGTALGVAAFVLVAALAGGPAGPAGGAVSGWAGAAVLALTGAVGFTVGNRARRRPEPADTVPV
jgi:predicted MFS family arabinose efflux permease